MASAKVICEDPACEWKGKFFKCAECKRNVCWCQGADDDYPELCSDCWETKEHVDAA